MDPITHGALGAASSQAILYPQDKKNVWIVGALAGMAADLDIFIRSHDNPLILWFYHRHFTHSLIFIPVGGVLLSLFLMIFKRFRPHWRITLFASVIGYSTHCLLDALTSYGTLLYWPFTNYRVAWDIVSIVDPFFTAPLILGVIYTQLYENRIGVFLGLLVASLLLIFNTYQHQQALKAANYYAEENKLNYSKLRALPQLASSLNWRILMDLNQKQLWVGNVKTSLFSPGKLSPLRVFPLSQKLGYVYQAQQEDYDVFKWFSDGYVIEVCKESALVADGRFIADVHPLLALWGLQFVPAEKHPQLIELIDLDKIHC